MTSFLKDNFKGLLFAAFIGLLSHYGADFIPQINGVMLAILLGVLLRNSINIPKSFNKGVSFASSKVLEFAILFLAFSISFKHIASLGWQNFLLVLLMIVIVLPLILLMANKMKCPDSTGWLIGFGTAICGSSAIAAVAPGVAKSKQDVGIAIAVINLIGAAGMIVLPFVLKWFPISDINAGVIIGASLHSVGNVAGAGYGLEKVVGDTAITVKLARVALLSPAVIYFTYLVNRNKPNVSGKSSFQLPYYLWGFILISLFTSFVEIPASILTPLKEIGKILLTIAMAAIGLKISFKQLYQSGKIAIGYGIIIFGVQIVVILVLMTILNLV